LREDVQPCTVLCAKRLSRVYIICNKYANGMRRDAARKLHHGVLYCSVSHVLTFHRTAVVAFTAVSKAGLSVRRLAKNSQQLNSIAWKCCVPHCTKRCDSFPAPSQVCVTPPISTKFTFGQQHFVHKCCTKLQ
jgi:hypothetical protein